MRTGCDGVGHTGIDQQGRQPGDESGAVAVQDSGHRGGCNREKSAVVLVLGGG